MLLYGASVKNVLRGVGLTQDRKFLGNGRSARVYLATSQGKPVANKIFTGETTSKIILFTLTGSANPYTWCEAAIKSAMSRRKILSQLCKYWYGDKVRLPETYGYSWNEEEKAFQIDAEFIPGTHVPLLSPLKENPRDFAAELRKEIMEPLQKRLIDSGFDGLVWQAGKGNPVADSNFMLMKNPDGSFQWVWIDLESGVPAIFAMNFLSTLFFYLPKCLKHREWMFDTVDIKKLETYLTQNADDIDTKLGEGSSQELMKTAAELSKTQNEWKGIKRYRRSILYAESQGKISSDEKDYYFKRPIAWYLKSVITFSLLFFKKLGRGVVKLIKKISGFDIGRFFHHTIKYTLSARYRWGVARWYLQKDIKKWYARKSIDREGRKFLLSELHKDDVSSYLTDFSVHLALKPLDKLLSLLVVPLITAYGIIDVKTGVIAALAVGPVTRTLYTLWRFTHSLVRRRHNYPVIALIIGALPVVGNLAYPLELLFRGSGNRDYLAKFILYSFSAKIGAKLPVWGGKDSGTEHFFNRWTHKLLG